VVKLSQITLKAFYIVLKAFVKKSFT